MSNQEKKSVDIKMVGKVLFPKEENEKFSFCLGTNPDTNYQSLLDNKCNELDSALGKVKASYITFDNVDYDGFNMKSSYDFPVYNEKGIPIDIEDVGLGSEVIVRASLSEYTYRNKKGFTLYIRGMIVTKLMKPKTISFDDIMNYE